MAMELGKTEKVNLAIQTSILVCAVLSVAITPWFAICSAVLAFTSVFVTRAALRRKDIELQSMVHKIRDENLAWVEKASKRGDLQIEELREVAAVNDTWPMDDNAFVSRLVTEGPSGPVGFAFPSNASSLYRDREVDKEQVFGRLWKLVRSAGWPVIENIFESQDGVSGYGITLRAFATDFSRAPAHLRTLHYAFERSGLRVHLDFVPAESRDEVIIVVGDWDSEVQYAQKRMMRR